MSETNKITETSKSIFIKVIAVVILVFGLVGLLFFATAGLYKLSNPQFLSNLGYSKFEYLNIYILIQVIIYGGYSVGAVLIARFRKPGYYIFFSVLLVSLVTELVYENLLVVNLATMGVFGFLLLGYMLKSFVFNKQKSSSTLNE